MIIFYDVWKNIFDWWFSWFVLDPDNVIEDKEDDKTPQEQS